MIYRPGHTRKPMREIIEALQKDTWHILKDLVFSHLHPSADRDQDPGDGQREEACDPE